MLIPLLLFNKHNRDVHILSIPVYSFSVKENDGRGKQVQQQNKILILPCSFFLFQNKKNNPKKTLHLCVIKGKKIGINKVFRYKIIIHYSFSVHSSHSPPGQVIIC